MDYQKLCLISLPSPPDKTRNSALCITNIDRSKQKTYSDEQSDSLKKCLQLIKWTYSKQLNAGPGSDGDDACAQTPASDDSGGKTNANTAGMLGGDLSQSMNSIASLACSPSMENLAAIASCGSSSSLGAASRLSKYIPEVNEIRVGTFVSKMGWLNFLEEKSNGWLKRWVVIRPPYAFFYKMDSDPVERGLLHLSTARIDYGEDRDAMLRLPNGLHTFCVCTPHRGFLMQTTAPKEVHEWLYAINPLAAGLIRWGGVRRAGRKCWF